MVMNMLQSFEVEGNIGAMAANNERCSNSRCTMKNILVLTPKTIKSIHFALCELARPAWINLSLEQRSHSSLRSVAHVGRTEARRTDGSAA
jgi:hypothetical protein